MTSMNTTNLTGFTITWRRRYSDLIHGEPGMSIQTIRSLRYYEPGKRSNCLRHQLVSNWQETTWTKDIKSRSSSTSRRPWPKCARVYKLHVVFEDSRVSETGRKILTIFRAEGPASSSLITKPGELQSP